jgi:hypothetical protein
MMIINGKSALPAMIGESSRGPAGRPPQRRTLHQCGIDQEGDDVGRRELTTEILILPELQSVKDVPVTPKLIQDQGDETIAVQAART